jgi:hypothetical protein
MEDFVDVEIKVELVEYEYGLGIVAGSWYDVYRY